jgi:hypothetical protein
MVESIGSRVTEVRLAYNETTLPSDISGAPREPSPGGLRLARVEMLGALARIPA